mmetsp:Transcript_59288/g.165525  ORF Transcript_59288/g.165525 Transcript_59288/m.165525 type:complete len:290 (+) Transcript_59288:93-962(+)
MTSAPIGVLAALVLANAVGTGKGSFLRAYSARRRTTERTSAKGNASKAIEVAILEALDDGGFPADLGDCALVGSSAVLSGSGRGADIDRHETVIRVNRLPILEYFEDFGSKTDVIVLNEKLSTHGQVEYLGGARRSCVPKHVDAEPVCNVTAVVLKGRGVSARAKWARSGLRVGMMMPLQRDVASAMPAMDKILPSAGFLAFLTVAPLCSSLTLYGFGGSSGTADGHIVGEFGAHHDFETENSILDRIVAGVMRPSDWDSNDKAMPSDQHLLFRRLMEAKVGRMSIVRD